MTYSGDFRPDWASPPGDTIREILAERRISVREFGRRMKLSLERTNELLEGRAAMTITIARDLQRLFGASVEFWMSRDFQFRDDAAKLHGTEQEWLADLPVGDMVRFGWLKPAPHPADEVSACLRFFDVHSIRAWHENYSDLARTIAFRTSPSLDSSPGAVIAWLRQGEIEAGAIDCAPWNSDRFRESLSQILPLTRIKDPGRFIPELQRICASVGVGMVVVRAPAGCRASGATRFLSKDRALLLLSFRYLTDDHFWFTFFHEAGHLLLHSQKTLFIEGTDAPESSEEREANDFAARTLVPLEHLSELLKLRPTSREVVRFARRLRVAPGIIVGQLQHLRRIRHNQLNGLKRRFRWED